MKNDNSIIPSSSIFPPTKDRNRPSRRIIIDISDCKRKKKEARKKYSVKFQLNLKRFKRNQFPSTTSPPPPPSGEIN